MKNLMRKTCWVGMALVVCIATCGLAGAAPVTMNLTSAGAGFVLDGVYISPYSATISNVGSGTVSVPVICDDFVDDTYLTETWGVNQSSIAGLGNVKWGASNQLSYDEVALLSQQLLGLAPTVSNEALMGQLSYAIWAVFDPTGVAAWLNSYGDATTCKAVFGNSTCNTSSVSSSSLLGTYQAEAQAALTNPTAAEKTLFADMLVYTPTNSPTPTCANGPCSNPVTLPQEFLYLDPPTVSTPEPSEIATLGVDLFGFAVLIGVFRKRLFGSAL